MPHGFVQFCFCSLFRALSLMTFKVRLCRKFMDGQWLSGKENLRRCWPVEPLYQVFDSFTICWKDFLPQKLLLKEYQRDEGNTNVHKNGLLFLSSISLKRTSGDIFISFWNVDLWDMCKCNNSFGKLDVRYSEYLTIRFFLYILCRITRDNKLQIFLYSFRMFDN
jgi:hypothetical protein